MIELPSLPFPPNSDKRRQEIASVLLAGFALYALEGKIVEGDDISNKAVRDELVKDALLLADSLIEALDKE